MKLRDLDARFKRVIDERHFETVETLKEADGIFFLCPLCFEKNAGAVNTHSVLIWFAGKSKIPSAMNPGRNGALWAVTGTGLDDLTTTPSIQMLMPSCNWHGFITNGDAK